MRINTVHKCDLCGAVAEYIHNHTLRLTHLLVCPATHDYPCVGFASGTARTRPSCGGTSVHLHTGHDELGGFTWTV